MTSIDDLFIKLLQEKLTTEQLLYMLIVSKFRKSNIELNKLQREELRKKIQVQLAEADGDSFVLHLDLEDDKEQETTLDISFTDEDY
ncbi:MAG: hypothetical protein H7175_01995, partial [Burkholderiales bacterium]|nr:hypothetical protein [Anaerolineae bacterium]